MMLFKLSVRNMRRSLREYTLYFGTLIVSVSIFYVFNSLSSQDFLQSILFRAPEHFTANIEAAMTTISIFISILLIFLIVYGNSFIIKRRKKELGVYLTLGMDRENVFKILFGETIFIAILSIMAGIGIGIPLSQLMSVSIFRLLGVYVTGFTFVFNWSVVFRTILYFTVVFLSVSLVSIVTVANSKIFNLLGGDSKQTNYTKFLGISSGIAFVLVVVGFGYGAFTMLTLNLDNLFMTGVGGVEIMLAFSGGIIGTFALFLCLTGLLTFIVKQSKKIALRGLNIFTLRQITRRVHLNWLSLSLITLMMTVSIFMLVVGRGLTSTDAMAYNNRPFDGVISIHDEIDFDSLEVVDDVFLLREFELYGTRIDSLVNVEVPNWIDWIKGFVYEDVRAIFDYHDTPLPRPASDEVLLLVSDLDIDETYLLKEQITVSYYEDWEARNNLLRETFDVILTVMPENLLLTGEQTLMFDQVVLVFPPSLDLSDMPFSRSTHGIIGRERNHFLFDFNTDEQIAEPIFWEFANDVRDETGGWSWSEYDILSTTSNTAFNVTTTNWIRVNSNLMSIFMTFATLYIGGVFLLVSLTILFLQQMIDVVESEKSYVTLSQLGVDVRMRNRSLLVQGFVYFLIPLITASIHSFFILQIFLPLFTGEIGDAPAGMDFNQAVYAMTRTFIGVIIVYIVYFILAYAQTKRIIGAKRN